MKTELKIAIAAANFFKRQADDFEKLGNEMSVFVMYAYELVTLYEILEKAQGLSDEDLEGILNNIDGSILIQCVG